MEMPANDRRSPWAAFYRAAPMAVIVALSLCAAGRASARCEDLVAKPASDGLRRALIEDDLLGIRDIGFNNGLAFESPLAISPDGQRVSFVLTRADSDQNDYCQALLTLPLHALATPDVEDRGGAPILAKTAIRGVMVTSGAFATISPRWSPDGRFIAYVRRVGGFTVVTIVRAGGKGEIYVSRGADVEKFAWSADGRSLIYSTVHPPADIDPIVQDSERSGYVYDDRFFPDATIRPAPRAPVQTSVSAFDVDRRELRNANAEEASQLEPEREASAPADALSTSRSRDGTLFWTRSLDTTNILSPINLWARTASGRVLECSDPACAFGDKKPLGIWASRAPKTALFLRREGWGSSRTALYTWTIGKRIRRLFSTDDLVSGCVLNDRLLLCTREGSNTPRTIVAIDVETGRVHTVYDPNPSFRQLALSPAIRLHWRNTVGFECFGDLVLPPDYRKGHPVPLIIVQYRTRGFLRGALGNEYPIQLFAQRGYAVLSLDSPPPFFESVRSGHWASWDDAEKENVQNWSERRSNLSSLLTIVDSLVARGIVDRSKVGITGLSDGATTVQFALTSRPTFFAAASISTGFLERENILAYGGTGFATSMKLAGYPDLTTAAPEIWKPFSVAANADRITTPILMNIPDAEEVMAVQDFAVLRDFHRPVEMIIYPDEFHNKWQPSHTKAIYERNLDWFDFWMKGKVDPAPDKRVQYERWLALKLEAHAKPNAEPMLQRQPAS